MGNGYHELQQVSNSSEAYSLLMKEIIGTVVFLSFLSVTDKRRKKNVWCDKINKKSSVSYK